MLPNECRLGEQSGTGFEIMMDVLELNQYTFGAAVIGIMKDILSKWWFLGVSINKHALLLISGNLAKHCNEQRRFGLLKNSISAVHVREIFLEKSLLLNICVLFTLFIY